MPGRRTIGIDLGTTNSVVATIDRDGIPRIITNAEGSTTTPSIAAFVDDDDRVPQLFVGERAARAAVHIPDHTVFAIKRLLGRRYDEQEVQRLATTLPYDVVPAPNGDAWAAVREMTLSPQELSALVLRELRRTAESFFDGPVAEAIITVPAYFDNQQRRATVDAATIAGLEVRRLINEPTAAALGYGAHRGDNQRYAVCDVGGGTFDVSIVNVEDGVFEVLSTHGDPFLGGDDFDRAIMQQLVAEVHAAQGIDLATDPRAMQRLKVQAQEAKHGLTDANRVTVDLSGFGQLPSGRPVQFTRTIVRAELDSWTQPLLSRLEPPCREALARARLAPRDVDAVILVGGMTRMPAVRDTLAAAFECRPLTVENPEEIVAVGAAIQCALLDGTIEGVVLLDVTSRALSVCTNGQLCQRVTPRNATIPSRAHKIVATTEDDQRELTFDVYEGESPQAVQNRHLGRYVCGPLPAAPAGEVLLLVEFTVDVDGILHVSVSELSSGYRPELRLVATAGLTRAEVRRLAVSITEDSP